MDKNLEQCVKLAEKAAAAGAKVSSNIATSIFFLFFFLRILRREARYFRLLKRASIISTGQLCLLLRALISPELPPI